MSVTIGTIFAIYKRVNSDQNDESNLLQEGNKAIAAGYTVYGSSTVMCISTKEDTSMFSFDKKKHIDNEKKTDMVEDDINETVQKELETTDNSWLSGETKFGKNHMKIDTLLSSST